MLLDRHTGIDRNSNDAVEFNHIIIGVFDADNLMNIVLVRIGDINFVVLKKGSGLSQ